MPSYVCTTVAGRLSGGQRSQIAELITRAHHEATGAPAWFVRVQFEELAPDALFVGGAPLDHDHLFIFGHIRSGRDAATRSRIAHGISAGVRSATDLHHRGLWIYLCELPPENMVEFGHVLPQAGDESAWQAALPDDDRQWMQSLGRG